MIKKIRVFLNENEDVQVMVNEFDEMEVGLKVALATIISGLGMLLTLILMNEFFLVFAGAVAYVGYRWYKFFTKS